MIEGDQLQLVTDLELRNDFSQIDKEYTEEIQMTDHEKFDDALKYLYGEVFRLRIENEVNKTIIHGLKEVLRNDSVLIDDVISSIRFTSAIVAKKITSEWSKSESEFFTSAIQHEISTILSMQDELI